MGKFDYEEYGAQIAFERDFPEHKSSDKGYKNPTKNQRITILESKVVELVAKVEALEKLQAKPKSAAVTPENIAVGDKIRVIDADEISGGIDLISGNIYEVNYVYSDGDFEIIDEVGDEVVVECCQPAYFEKVVSE